MRIIGYTEPKKYSVLVYNYRGEPCQDRQCCANNLKDATAIAMKDMDEYPFSCAAIYVKGPKAVREITADRKVKKIG